MSSNRALSDRLDGASNAGFPGSGVPPTIRLMQFLQLAFQFEDLGAFPASTTLSLTGSALAVTAPAPRPPLV